VYAGWCGSCSSTTFNSGVATNVSGEWKQLPMMFKPAGSTELKAMPKRYIAAVTIDPADTTGNTVYVTYNGFSARYIEGFGAGYGHVYKSTDGGATFVDVSGEAAQADSLPDVPTSDMVIDGAGNRYLATDVGVFVSARDQDGHWKRMVPATGSALPTTISSDLQLFTDSTGTYLYDGTFGRGIWRTKVS
jgi:hypothetical protein